MNENLMILEGKNDVNLVVTTHSYISYFEYKDRFWKQDDQPQCLSLPIHSQACLTVGSGQEVLGSR